MELKPDDLALTRSEDHSTSIAAAKKVERRVSPLMRAVHKALKAAGEHGLTDSEINAAMLKTGHPPAPESTYRKRRTDLVALGYATWSLERRANARGSMEKVWVVTTKEPDAP